MTYRKLVYLIIFIISSFSVHASHFSGGQISWTNVGTDSFLMELTIYRDCSGVTLSDPELSFTVRATSVTFKKHKFSSVSPVNSLPLCISSCSRCDSANCTFPYGIEKYVFSEIVYLGGAGTACEIDIEYHACCRSNIITTGSGGQGYRLTAMLNKCLGSSANSPIFITDPRFIGSLGQDMSLYIGIEDPDRDANGNALDSLHIEWVSPLKENGDTIGFAGSYTYDKPIYFWGFPNSNLPFPRGLLIDIEQQSVLFKPMKIESTILTFKISEFRNGVKIGELMHEQQLIIVSTSGGNNSPILTATTYNSACHGKPFIFNINTNDYDSKDSLSIFYTSPIPGASWSDNNGQVKKPTGTLIWTPSINDIRDEPYAFTCMVTDNVCPVPSFHYYTFFIYVQENPSIQTELTYLGCGKYKFKAIGPPNYSSSKFAWFIENDIYHNNEVIHQFQSSGQHSIRLGAYNSDYCNYDTSFNLQLPSFMQVDLTNDTTVCAGTAIQLTPIVVNNSGPVEYNWNYSGWTTNPTFNINATKDTLIYLMVNDTSSCTVLDSIQIHINPEIPDLTFDKNTICEGESINLTASGGISYSWSTGDSTSTIVVKPTNSSWVDVTIVDQYNCSKKDSVFLTVHSSPVAEFNVNQSGGTEPLSVTFINQSSISNGTIQRYHWDFGDGDTSDLLNPSNTYQQYGSYTVTLETYSDKGCYNSKIKADYIVVDKVGLNELRINSLKITPNPAQDHILVETGSINNSKGNIEIYNEAGKLIISENRILQSRNYIDTSELKPGIYFINIKSGTGLQVGTFVIE